MSNAIRKNLQQQIQARPQPMYVVFPESHSVPVSKALELLSREKNIRILPLSKEILETGRLDELIKTLSKEFWQITRQYYKKQVRKGRMTEEQYQSFDLTQAEEALHDPLNLALMMVRRGLADAEVGGVETSTAEHTRKALYIVQKNPLQENIVCSATLEFDAVHRIEDQHGLLREQRFLTIADPALGKPSMEYSFLTGGKLLKSLADVNEISSEVYQRRTEQLEQEKQKYIQLKCDQALSALRWHKILTGEKAVGAFITHSTAGSDKLSDYIQLIRGAVIPAIKDAISQLSTSDHWLKDARFISQECQVEAASDPRIGQKKAKEEELAGFANVHLCSSVLSANQHYKTFLAFKEIRSLICWSGFQKPIFDLSRSSPVEDIVLSAMVAAIKSEIVENVPEREFWYKTIVGAPLAGAR